MLSEAATISASHEDSAMVACFLEPQEMAAELYEKLNETRGGVLHSPVRVRHAS